MSTPPPRCRHLHTDGRQCGSPAVRHEKLCYQHLAARQRPSHTPTLPDPEDLHAVQRGLAELLRLVSRELIEDRQAKRLFAILTAAGTNLARLDRQQRAARELDLRQRALALVEARLAAKHPETSLSGCHSRRESASPAPHSVILTEGQADPGCSTFNSQQTVSSSLRWAGEARANPVETTQPVTEPIDDPILGPLAPGPDPEPRPEPAPANANETGCPTFAAASSPLRWDHTATPTLQPEQPSRARQAEMEAELEAEAAEQIEFDRRENAWKEENARIRRDNYTIKYNLLTPEAQLKEDLRRAELDALYNGTDLPLGPHPRWGITDQLF